MSEEVNRAIDDAWRSDEEDTEIHVGSPYGPLMRPDVYVRSAISPSVIEDLPVFNAYMVRLFDQVKDEATKNNLKLREGWSVELTVVARTEPITASVQSDTQPHDA